MERIPEDVYKRVTQVCKDYRTLLRRQREIYTDVIYGTRDRGGGRNGSGISDPTARQAEKIMRLKGEIERKIKAVEGAYRCLRDDTERRLIERNLFEHVSMEKIDLPMPIVTMKRVRKRFIVDVARRLDEI